MIDHEFELSRSLKVKYNATIGLPIYGFLIEFNSKTRKKELFIDQHVVRCSLYWIQCTRHMA